VVAVGRRARPPPQGAPARRHLCRRRRGVVLDGVDIDLAGPLQSSTDAVQNDAAAAAAAVSAAGVRGGRLRPLRADHDKPALHLSLNHGHPGQSGGTDEKVMS